MKFDGSLKNILFVCTGNTCRSPFAEFMMRKLLEERLGDDAASKIRISSAGTYAFSGVEPPPDAQRSAREFDVDLSPHRSRSIHLSMMEAADLILCMTAMHKAHLVARFPWFEDRIFILKKYAGGRYSQGEMETTDESFDIDDPIGKGIGEYRKVFGEIREYMDGIISLWQEQEEFRRRVEESYSIIAGSDHAGFNLKTDLVEYLEEQGHKVTDIGARGESPSVDYPDFARPVADAVAGGKYDFGLLVCGSGVGVSITANRVPGVRAVLARDALTAVLSRRHNRSNILCLGERFTTGTVARDILDRWLATQFDGGRHTSRIKKIDIGES